MTNIDLATSAAAAPFTPQPQSNVRSPVSLWLSTARIAFWLGWQIESNWTDPFRFFVYAIARPLGGALILVFMYVVVAQADRGPIIGYFLVGSAFWPYVVSGMQGMAWGIISDREHFRTLKYIYTAPIPYEAYLVGRSLSQMAAASAAAAVTLTLGRVFLDVPIGFDTLQWPLILAGIIFGLPAILSLGLLLVSLALSISGEAWRMPEGVGAALYLMCGVIFPLSVLPSPLQTIAKGIPLTWWLETMRRGVLGTPEVSSFPDSTDLQVVVALAVTTLIFALIATAVFQRGLRRARQLGILDRESAY
jgi:ABC-2 type transport system permease protein